MKAGRFLAIAMAVALTAGSAGCATTALRQFGAIVRESSPTVEQYFWAIDEGNHEKYAALLDETCRENEPLKKYPSLYQHVWERRVSSEAHFHVRRVTYVRPLPYRDPTCCNASGLSGAGLVKFACEKIVEEASEVSEEPLPEVADGATMKVLFAWELRGTTASGLLKKPRRGELVVTFQKQNGKWWVVNEKWHVEVG